MAEEPYIRLKSIRKDLEQRRQEKARLEGSREQLLATLKEKFNLNSLGEAQAEIDRRNKELGDIEARLTKGLDELDALMAGKV